MFTLGGVGGPRSSKPESQSSLLPEGLQRDQSVSLEGRALVNLGSPSVELA